MNNPHIGYINQKLQPAFWSALDYEGKYSVYEKKKHMMELRVKGKIT